MFVIRPRKIALSRSSLITGRQLEARVGNESTFPLRIYIGSV